MSVFSRKETKTWPISAAALLAASMANATAEEKHAAPWTVIYAGTVIADPSSNHPLKNKTIVVEGGAIRSIEDGFKTLDQLGAPGDTKAIDLKGATLLPGFIDLHTHILASQGSQSLAGVTTWSDARWALSALPNLTSMLNAGFTTIRDVGSFNDSIYDLQRAVAVGVVEGPEIIAVREMLTPSGGHGDMAPTRSDVHRDEPLSICNGPIECRAAVRKIALRGADLIKIKVTGGVLSGAGVARDNVMFPDEIAEIVRTAHAENLKVAAHALTSQSAAWAVDAGVDTLEHGTDLTPSTMSTMVKKGIPLVPTLGAAKYVSMLGDPDGDKGARRVASVWDRTSKSVYDAYRKGVAIAFGTDVGVVPAAAASEEFSLMGEIGIPPRDVIASATIVAAQALGRSDDLGRIAPGFQADIVAVDGDPLTNVSVLRKVVFVMSDGLVRVNAPGDTSVH